MSIPFETKFSRGDVVTCKNKTSILFRRDCVVVYTDPTFFGVISEGLDEVYFLRGNDDDFSLMTSGGGKFTAEQDVMLQEVVKRWPLVNTLTKLQKLIDIEAAAYGVDKESSSQMVISASVPVGLINYWRRLRAVLELARPQFPDDIPQDVEQMMMVWAMMSTFKIVPILVLKNTLEGGNQ
jgi:hypothetical protein